MSSAKVARFSRDFLIELNLKPKNLFFQSQTRLQLQLAPSLEHQVRTLKQNNILVDFLLLTFSWGVLFKI